MKQFLQNTHIFLGDFSTYPLLGTFRNFFNIPNAQHNIAKHETISPKHSSHISRRFRFTFHSKPTHFGTYLKHNFPGYQPRWLSNKPKGLDNFYYTNHGTVEGR